MPKRIANKANILAKNRLDSLETYSNANNIGGNTSEDPKSGCKKINTIGKPNTKITLVRVWRESRKRPISERARIPAARISVPILAGSEG